MDKFDKVANQLMRSVHNTKQKSVMNEQSDEKVIYSSDNEEDAETLPANKDQQTVIGMARDTTGLGTPLNPKVGPGLSSSPQQVATTKVANAYTGLMTKLATKIDKMSQTLK